MMYFPAPNLEPIQEINIDFTTISKASTGSTPASELYIPIVKGAVGDRIFIFMYAKYAASTVLIEAGWTSNAGSGYNPTYGQMQAYSKISNGTETRVRLYTEGGGVADISGFSFRVKGFLNPLVNTAYYGLGEISSADTVVATANMAQRPFISNYIYFTAMGKVGGTPLTSSDIPTAPSSQVFLDSNTTSSTSFVVSYFKSKDANLSLNTTWPNTENARRSIGFYIQSDQRALGDTQGTNASGSAYASTSTHFLCIYPHFTKKASGYEEVYEFVFRTGGYIGTPDGVFQIGLYDITNGYAGAPLCVSASTSTILPNRINRIPITPYKLTQDKVYAIGFRSSITNTAPSASINIFSTYAGNFALRRSTLTGSSALSSTWSDAGTTSDSRFTVGASVRYTNLAPARMMKQISSKINKINPKLKQPIGPVVINDSSPLSKKLVFHYATHNETSYATSILYGKLPAKINSTMRPHLGTPFGKGLDFYETATVGRIKGISFGQRSQYVLTGLENEFSVAFWARWSLQDGTNRNNILLAKGISGSSTQDWLIGGSIYANGIARPTYSALGGTEFSIPGSVSLNKWYRCVLTKKGNIGTWYINGKVENTTTSFPTYTPNANNRYLVMGQDSLDAKSSFYGIPHSIMIWHRELSLQDVILDYTDTYSPFTSLFDLSNYYYEVPEGIFEVTSVDGDDTVYDNQVVNIVGTGFGYVQGLVFIDGVQQSINSWSDTLINITVEQGALSLGANTLKVFKPI